MEPLRVLNLFTNMNRGGAETMVMNYYRALDRSKIQFDFMVHRPARGDYEDEIESLGGRVFRMPPIRLSNLFLYQKRLNEFFRDHPEHKIVHSHMSELGYFALKAARRRGVPVRICHAHNYPLDFNDLVAAMRKMMASEAMRARMSAEGRIWAENFEQKDQWRKIVMHRRALLEKFGNI